jgi:tetratricopeptide (TPR) repeat protein
MSLQKSQAIQTALNGNWEVAITINEEILSENPTDIETLNRLAFAYTVSGRVKDAKQTYERVLEIDIFNPIALRNLKRLGEFTPGKAANGFQICNDMFLEESGKTKILSLLNTAQPKLLKSLQVGQVLQLSIKRLKIFVLDAEHQYIGMLPDNIGKRLIKFINGGNVYEVYVKSVDLHNVVVFVKEKKKAARFKNQSSFSSSEKTNFTITKGSSKKNQTSDEADEEA